MYKFAINRPITTLMGVMAFVVFGLISFGRMPVNLFPNVDLPIVTVQTYYYGADPETVESKVSDKIEEVLSGIDGIDKLRSTSYEGLSVVTVEFELTKNIDEAANDVRDKVASLVLPNEVEKPTVSKLDVGGGSVINLFIATKSGDWSALMQLADERIKPRLQRIRGVGSIDIVGYRDREIRIYPDPFLLNKYGLSVTELNHQIALENVRLGGGKVIGSGREVVIKTEGDAKSIEGLRAIQVAPGVLLSDIARVEDGLKDAQSYSSLDGIPGVILEVKKISGANTLDIIRAVKASLPEIKQMSGEDYTLALLKDGSLFIQSSINNVKFDLIFGSLLAVLIVFIFLRNLTATIVSALAIPTSVIGTFAVIDWLGYDLNRLTLIGLTLAIGIFIDDAIVVIENISKKLEAGVETFQASYEGVKEIAFSILAISAMLLAVFIPVAFMDGIVGRFFNSFAMTVAAGVVISYFVAIMFIPALGARLLKRGESWFYHKTEGFFKGLDRAYVMILRPLVRFKYLTIIGVIGIVVASGGLLKYIGNDFVPMEDKSEMRIVLKGPTGMSLDAMKREVTPIMELLAKDSMIETSALSIGYTTAKEVHKAKIYVKLVPVEKRALRQEEIVQGYRERLKQFDAFKILVMELPAIEGSGMDQPVQIVLQGDSLQTLQKSAEKLVKILEADEGVVDVDTNYDQGKPELSVEILRQNAKQVGVSVDDIARVVNTAFSSDRAVSNYEEQGKQYDITLRFADEYRTQLEDLKRLQVKNSEGRFISLEGLVEIKERFGPSSINRMDRQRQITVNAGIYGVSLDHVVALVKAKEEMFLPKGYHYRFTGDIENMEETNQAFGMAIGLMVILMFLILASLYESLIQPIIIMIAMPLSFLGVITALFLSGMDFNLFVMIGVILLLGMVGKNAVLVVDFANQAIKEGHHVEDALIQAGEKRLRPILMTTFAMIFAMLPLAFGSGAGHESNSPMAMAIIGGLVSSTLLTLLVVPAFYRLLYPIDAFLRKWYERGTVA